MDIDFALRIFIAGMLGGAIGLEREYRAKEAGFRTHFLVSLGSALFMILSCEGVESVNTMWRVPIFRSIKCNASRQMSTITVAEVAKRYIPEPHVKPMADVTQSPAAVVSPCTTCF